MFKFPNIGLMVEKSDMTGSKEPVTLNAIIIDNPQKLTKCRSCGKERRPGHSYCNKCARERIQQNEQVRIPGPGFMKNDNSNTKKYYTKY